MSEKISENKKKEDAPSIGQLTYSEKCLMLENIITDLQSLVEEFAPMAGRVAELKARIEVNKLIKSALQSALRAERAVGY